MQSFAAFFLFACYFVEKSVQDCTDIKSCVSCVQESSWFSNCRWCPVDNQCHAYGSLENPCQSSQDVENSGNCPVITPCPGPPDYNPELSFKLFQYAALAYSDYPENCRQVNDGSNGRQIIAKFSRSCDLFYNCFAYLAVDSSANAIILAYRGSQQLQAAVEALETLLPDEPADIGGKVNHYFKSGFDDLWQDVLNHLQMLLNQMPGANIWVTGHSLGGALASLASTEIVYLKLASRSNVYLYTFGEPRVGDHDYATAHNDAIQHSYRVVNQNDLVPHIPPCQADPASYCTTSYSYHHLHEIWYQKGMSYGPDMSFRSCPGYPCGESEQCSDSLGPDFSIDAHSRYFGIDGVSTFNNSHCDRNLKQDTPLMRLVNRVKYKKDKVFVVKVVTE